MFASLLASWNYPADGRLGGPFLVMFLVWSLQTVLGAPLATSQTVTAYRWQDIPISCTSDLGPIYFKVTGFPTYDCTGDTHDPDCSVSRLEVLIDGGNSGTTFGLYALVPLCQTNPLHPYYCGEEITTAGHYYLPFGTTYGPHTWTLQMARWELVQRPDQSYYYERTSDILWSASTVLQFVPPIESPSPWRWSTRQFSWQEGSTSDIGIEITYDPMSACDGAPCDLIELIQAVRPVGHHPGSSRVVTWRELKFFGEVVGRADLAQLLTTPTGWKLDMPFELQHPFYTEGTLDKTNTLDGYGPPVHPGQSGSNAYPAFMYDAPHPLGNPTLQFMYTLPAWHLSEFTQPGDWVDFEFEVNAFCAAGSGRGKWLGRFRWEARYAQGQNSIITVLEDGTSMPNVEFLDALDLWGQYHTFFRLPAP